jgi:hypothetical protein
MVETNVDDGKEPLVNRSNVGPKFQHPLKKARRMRRVVVILSTSCNTYHVDKPQNMSNTNKSHTLMISRTEGQETRGGTCW